MEDTKTTVTHFWHEEESDILIWLLVLIALVAGLLVRNSVVNDTRVFSGASIALNYPARWFAQPKPGSLFSVADGLDASVSNSALTVQQLPFAKVDAAGTALTLDDNALAWSVQAGKGLTGYQVLASVPASVRGVPAKLVDYAFVQTHGAGGVSNLPVVVRAQSLLAQRGDQLIVITFTAAADAWDSAAGQWQAVQNSIVFK